MSVQIDKWDNGYVVRSDYPQSTPARRTVHEGHRSMIREVLLAFGLINPWDDLKVTVTDNSNDKPVVKEL